MTEHLAPEKEGIGLEWDDSRRAYYLDKGQFRYYMQCRPVSIINETSVLVSLTPQEIVNITRAIHENKLFVEYKP